MHHTVIFSTCLQALQLILMGPASAVSEVMCGGWQYQCSATLPRQLCIYGKSGKLVLVQWTDA